MAKNVTVINAIKYHSNPEYRAKLRVCAYVRVSTGSKAQANSYAVQINYYTKKIEENPLWEFAGIYADEAQTGTKVKVRDDFQAMIQECEKGNIDLIITKSVTRFARNTVESIQTIRKLKALGVGIYFEEEDINTLTEDSELMITILSSIAQAEAEDISTNNKWAIRKRFQDGMFIVSEPAYGYGKDEKGNLIINPEEAKVVRLIFKYYLNGFGTYLIAEKLNELGIPTKKGAKEWQDSVIKDILKNPVYEGDLLMQKTFTENTFPFTRKTNKGEVERYLIEDNHPPIITREEAQAVRDIKKYRAGINKSGGTKCNNRYLFSSRIVCRECGSYLRRQKIYIGTSYEKIVWTCPKHVKDKEFCKMKAIREDEIQEAFAAMWNKLYTNQGTVLEPLLSGLKRVPAGESEIREVEKLNKEIQNLTEQCSILNQVMKKGYMDIALFIENQNLLTNRLSECRKKKAWLLTRQSRRNEIIKTEQLIGLLKNEERIMKKFEEELFDMTVKEIIVSRTHDITFCLHNGLELTEKNLEEEQGGESHAVAYTDGI
ncbi:MAG: recombinase family protein [Eubacterium sp.]|nr:recombinase family protein [Eubacterium sp.]